MFKGPKTYPKTPLKLPKHVPNMSQKLPEHVPTTSTKCQKNDQKNRLKTYDQAGS